MSLRLAGRDVESLLIVGYGMTGRAVAGFCERRGVRFAVSEDSVLPGADEAWLRDHAREVETGGHTLRLLNCADAVVASPGAPAHLPLFAAAAERGIPVWSELDIAWAAVAGRRLVAVTGTNGKSTTVSLIGALLGRSGIRATVAGNIGLPFLDIVDEADCWDVAVLEVSSFQLEQSVLFHPHVAVLLNLAPNHLERHGTMPAYVAAKLRLFSHQTPLDAAILPASLAGTVDHGLGRLVLYDQPCPPLPRESETVGEVRRLDLAAAVTACREIVPGFDASRWSVHEFAKALYLPFRQQPVGTIGGVHVVNDSKATSPAATMAALRSVQGPVVLLLGGRSKRGGYDELACYLSAFSPRGVVVFGEARQEIAEHLSRAGVEHQSASDFESAVTAGLAAARPGDTLLLSPACSSFDAFRGYEERGEEFNRIARRLPGFRAADAKDI
ncbi:MAG: UDP-N-acetylmuramoyl-L-alanine--D-glutamate ligase [bacterium]